VVFLSVANKYIQSSHIRMMLIWSLLLMFTTSLLAQTPPSPKRVGVGGVSLVLISDDLYSSAIIRPNSGNFLNVTSSHLRLFLHNNRLITITNGFNRKFLAKCNLSENSFLQTNECFLSSSNSNNNVIAVRLNARTSLNRLRNLNDLLKQQQPKLSSILVVANTRLIAMIKIVLGDLNVPISGVDLQKFATIVDEDKLSGNMVRFIYFSIHKCNLSSDFSVLLEAQKLHMKIFDCYTVNF
jgi:hypothetical protein